MKKINWQYTFGEILIVIIGITIAFSLNRCSENAKEEKLLHQYLQSLKEDIQTDKKNLESTLTKLEEKKATIAQTFPYFYGQRPKKDSVLAMNFFKTVEVLEFSAKKSTYLALINSGDLKLISDFELKTTIEEHYRNYGQLDQDYERMINISKKYIADYFINNLDMDAFRIGKKAFTDERLLKSIMQSMFGAVDLKISSTKKSIESCGELLEKINTSLN